MKKYIWVFLLFLPSFLFAGKQPDKAPAPQNEIIVSGPVLGAVEHREIKIWLMSDSARTFQIVYNLKGQSKKIRSERVKAKKKNAFTVVFHLSELNPGATYEYSLFANDKPLPDGKIYEFTTQPHWQYRTDPPEFSFAAGSCSFINDTPFDRPGNPYGGDYQIFETIAGKKPDFMIWMGDNVYFRETDWYSRDGMNYRYRHDRKIPEFQKLLSGTVHYAIWNDHDFGPNNSNRTFIGKGMARSVFYSFWPNPEPVEKGIYTTFEYSDVQFFLTDGRTFRSPEYADSLKGEILGKRQTQWLIDALMSSTATFKVVVSGSQFLNPDSKYEAFNSAPLEREQILKAIVDESIPGVLFLSGDKHHAEVTKTLPPGGYPLYDFTSSPLTAGVSPASADRNSARLTESVYDGRNFLLISVKGKRKDRVFTASLFNSDGKQIWSYSIPEKELLIP